MDQQAKLRNNNLEKNAHLGSKDGLVQKNSSQSVKCHKYCTSNGLHHYNCLPSHLKFNKFVRTGYRMDLSTWQCLKSLFYLHNESFNIYSHGLSAILLILMTPYIYGKISSSRLYMFMYSIHHITSFLCVLFSTIYHLMMCHENGEKVYENLIKLDMLGIWLVTTFGVIVFIKVTLFCFPWLYKMVLTAYSLVGVVNLIYFLRGKTVRERFEPLVWMGLVRSLLYALRGYMVWSGYTSVKVKTVWFLLGMELFGFLGGVINTSRFPERWLDGKLDYMLNSHNIMHVVVLACPVFLHFGIVLDFQWMETAQCQA